MIWTFARAGCHCRGGEEQPDDIASPDLRAGTQRKG
nr:MAG TPA: hypothetical protein [Caudoviricetes sp.]